MAKKTQQEVRARRKTTSFSMVSNPIIDDKKITPAAGWLYVLIQRWVTFNAEDFVCSKSFLLSKYNAGEFMFNRAWDELKEAGYLKMFSHPTEGWEFELLDEAKADEPHTYYLDLKGEVKSTNIDRAKKKAEKQKKKEEKDHYPENHPNGDHYPENHSNGNHSNGNHSNGNRGNIINTSFKDFNNSFYNNYQSINHSEKPEVPTQQPKKKADRLIDMDLINHIKIQIGYDDLIKGGLLSDPIPKDELEIAIEAIASLAVANDAQEIGGNTYSPEFIRRRSLQINADHIRYVFECFYQHRDKVNNIKSYLTTAIFNAPATIGAYYANVVASSRAADLS